MTRLPHRNASGPASGPPLALSFADLQNVAQTAGPAGLLQSPARRTLETQSATLVPSPFVCAGMQELLSLSDDLLLLRSELSAGADAGGATRWRLDTRGWVYLHFRLDGLTCDETPDGVRRMIGGGSFFLAASSHPESIVREVLSDVWRVVTIAFRPSFATRDLQAPDAALPAELRRFQSGDPEVDFFYASQLTTDMSSAVRALLAPTIRTAVRPVYLRAKVVELVCLAIEQLEAPTAASEPPLHLTHRDTRALEEARRLLEQCAEPFSLEQLARRVGLNRRKLALGFKMLFGVTVGEHQREVRLGLAHGLLGAGNASVSYAAAVAGYSDVGSFGKAFRARYGCLPSELRPSAAARRLSAQGSNARPKSE